jgi:acyl carrier protein
MDVENKLREILLPVFELESLEEIQPGHSLISDLGADSLDFVEILFLIERNFKVVITAQDIMMGGVSAGPEEIFVDGILTENGYNILKDKFPGKAGKLKIGISKVDLFSLITVKDLADLVKNRMQSEVKNV